MVAGGGKRGNENAMVGQHLERRARRCLQVDTTAGAPRPQRPRQRRPRCRREHAARTAIQVAPNAAEHRLEHGDVRRCSNTSGRTVPHHVDNRTRIVSEPFDACS